MAGLDNKRSARVTKMKRGDRLLIEITATRKGVAVVKAPAGGTIRIEKSSPGLKEISDMA